MRRTTWLVAALLGARAAGAQAAADSGARLYPLLSVGAAVAVPATLADRSVSGTVSGAAYRESMRLRLDRQWGLIAEGRLPLGEAKVWGIEAYGSWFRGGARAGAARQAATGTVAGVPVLDSVDYHLSGVRSLRATLGAVRAFPLPAKLTGALLLGGTYGTVKSKSQPCSTTSCPPVFDLKTPGVTAGADAFTPEYHGVRFRLSLKADVLSVDEAEVRRQFRWSAFNGAPLGEGGRTWHTLPSFTLGIEFKIPL